MLSLIVTLILVAIIAGVVLWAWNAIASKIAEPFKTVIYVLIVLAIASTLIYVLLGKFRIPLNL